MYISGSNHRGVADEDPYCKEDFLSRKGEPAKIDEEEEVQVVDGRKLADDDLRPND
jgi:hypothetical protein